MKMGIIMKVFLVIASLTIVLGYPQPLPAEEPEREIVEEIPKIYNPPSEFELQPNSESRMAENVNHLLKKDVLARPDRSAAYTLYYPGVYYYPLKFRWNPYYYFNYYYWWL